MYCDYWNLREAPFENVPDPRFVYYSAYHDEARMRLVYAVKGHKGACILTGEVGTGKTTISRVFHEALLPVTCQVAIVTNPNLSCVELLGDIVASLGMKITGQETKLELLHGLKRLVTANLEKKRETVIVIDEAHLIEARDTFEELRLLLNFQQPERFMLTLIIVGQPDLRETMRRFPQFDQRIAIKYHLQPLSLTDTCKYIQFRLQAAGASRQLFTAGAAQTIFDYTGGIPRRINTLCDICLLTGYAERLGVIDETVTMRVIAEEM